MQITTQDIIRTARSWLRTPFHHQGRVKGAGVDCIGLIVGVINELNLSDGNGGRLSAHDDTNYSPLPDGVRLKAMLDEHLQSIMLSELAPGDIALFRFQQQPQHVGFITDRADGTLGILHCYSNSEFVIEHRLNEGWMSMLVQAYRFKPEQLITYEAQ